MDNTDLKKIEKNYEKTKEKSVIMITADALRPDVAIKLPFLGKLIKKGSFFSNVISYQPNSTGAFYSIFTGIYGNRSGVNSYFGSLTFKGYKIKTLTQYFKENGYFTIGHSMSDIILPKEGFHSYYPELNEHNVPGLYEKMIEAVKSQDKFFVHFHVAIIHSRVIENIAKKYSYNDKKYYNKVNENKKNYFKYALECDERIKKILSRFDLDNCFLIICSDHGTSYGEKFGERFYGSLCYDDTLRTFASFFGEGFPSFKYNKVVRGVDIMPTVLEAMKFDIDTKVMEMDGISLIPLINGDKISRIAFSEVAPLTGASNFPSPKEPNIHSIKKDNWKLIFYRSLDKYELYDLKNDVKEEKNLFGTGLMEEHEMLKYLREHLNNKDN